MTTHKTDQCFKAVWGPSLQLSNTVSCLYWLWFTVPYQLICVFIYTFSINKETLLKQLLRSKMHYRHRCRKAGTAVLEQTFYKK